MIPPAKNGEFVTHMEALLGLYKKPYDANNPVICMDEQPIQLVQELRNPLPASRNHGKRIDYEYKRAGSTNAFMFCEPLKGWRDVGIRSTKTKQDWAKEVARVLDTYYKDAGKVTLVCDNLNTHKLSSFYETFEPELARSYVERIELKHTPVHGSWLNIAESELSAMTRQCVKGRRFPTEEILKEEISQWSAKINKIQRAVNWQMTMEDARVKLRHLYPEIMT